MRGLSVAALLIAAAPGGALAQSSAATKAAEPVAAAGPAEDTKTPDIVVEGEVPPEQRRVCQMETTTGSIMPRRVCRTVAQIEEDQRIARESLEIIKRDRDTRSHIQASSEAGRQ